MKGNTSLDLKISISFLPSADEHLPCPSIYLPPPLPTLKFLGREKDTPKMSSTQLTGEVKRIQIESPPPSIDPNYC
jgi:hypothetical protein